MILRLLRFALGAVLAFSLTPVQADFAGPKADSAFRKAWHSLFSKLENCIHPLDPCNLDSHTRTTLQKLLQLQRECYRKVQVAEIAVSGLHKCGEPLPVSAELLMRDGVMLSDAKMTSLALQILQHASCESSLAQIDFDHVVKSAATVRYFSPLELNGTLYNVYSHKAGEGETLTVSVNALKVDVIALLRKHYPGLPEDVIFSDLEGGLKRDWIVVHGKIQNAVGRPATFSVSLDAHLNESTAFIYLMP